MTPEQKAKSEFVSRNLKPLLQAADGKIKNCVYITTMNGRRVQEGVVVVRESRDFIDRQIDINVTGDSLKALAADVLRMMTREWRL